MDEDILSGETYKVSDLIIEVLAQKGVGCIFGISGGASLHLLHSVVTNSNVELITMHHEQACAMAADGYARSSGNLGVAIATSGPGATNLLTGIAGCYYDSIPTIFITGQVSLNRQKGETGSRQIGFQETPIIKIVDEVTKYAIQVADPNDVLYELEKCIYIALSGRPGPVLLDVPDNEDDGFEDIQADESEMYEQGFTGGGNAPDMDISNIEPAYDFMSDGPGDVYPTESELDEDHMDAYEPMESAWLYNDEFKENDISGVQGIYGDMDPAYDFDSEGPGKAGPYQRSSYSEEYDEETDELDDLDNDIKESFIKQKNKIQEMFNRMKVVK